jgi:hypothetical protein
MPRRIREFALQSTTGAAVPAGQPDDYLDKVVKYVPADVIAAWTAAVAIIKGAVGIPTTPVLLICFVIGLGLTCWWTLKQTEAANQPPAIKQALIATVAFAVWVLALGDLSAALSTIMNWNEAYAKLLLILFTVVSGKL